MFRGHYHIWVETPPEPYTIFWDHMHSPALPKIAFILFVIVIWFGLLCV